MAKVRAIELLARFQRRLKTAGLWGACFRQGLIGRCWGCRKRGEHATHPGSTIVMCDGEEMVIIYQKGAVGDLEVETWRRSTEEGELGREVRRLAGLQEYTKEAR